MTMNEDYLRSTTQYTVKSYGQAYDSPEGQLAVLVNYTLERAGLNERIGPEDIGYLWSDLAMARLRLVITKQYKEEARYQKAKDFLDLYKAGPTRFDQVEDEYYWQELYNQVRSMLPLITYVYDIPNLRAAIANDVRFGQIRREHEYVRLALVECLAFGEKDKETVYTAKELIPGKWGVRRSRWRMSRRGHPALLDEIVYFDGLCDVASSAKDVLDIVRQRIREEGLNCHVKMVVKAHVCTPDSEFWTVESDDSTLGTALMDILPLRLSESAIEEVVRKCSRYQGFESPWSENGDYITHHVSSTIELVCYAAVEYNGELMNVNG